MTRKGPVAGSPKATAAAASAAAADSAAATAAAEAAGLQDPVVHPQPGGRFLAQGQAWVACQLKTPVAQTLWLQLPAQAAGQRSADGQLLFTLLPVDAEVLQEGQAFVQSLLAHGQVLLSGEAPSAQKTHEIQRMPDGRHRLQRRGYSRS